MNSNVSRRKIDTYPVVIAALVLLSSILLDLFGIPFVFEVPSHSTRDEQSAIFRFGMIFSVVAVALTIVAVIALVAAWRRRRWVGWYFYGLMTIFAALLLYQLVRRDFSLIGFSLVPAILVAFAARDYRRAVSLGPGK